jgi:hypothetical protein
MKPTRNSSVAILTALILFVALFVFFIYTFLHESGHAIVGLLAGQSLTEFNVNFWDFSAHVGMSGGELTQTQLAIRSVAGATLPLLVWALFISFVPRKANITLETLKLISSMAIVNTLLAWIILPVLFLFGEAPSDDVTTFLRYSQIPPLLLTFIAIVVYTAGWILFRSKIDGLRNEFRLFGKHSHETLEAGTRKTVFGMASFMTVCLIFVLAFNDSASNNSQNKFPLPQNFIPVAQLDLSKQSYSYETLTQFKLDKPAYVGVFIALRNINTTYFDLRVKGPNGFNSVVLHGEGYNALQDGGLWEKNLTPGTYQIVLTAHQSPGRASIYIKTH